MGKKYNSILEFAFSIDHNTLSGEDLSVQDVAKAFYKSIKDIEDQEIFDRVTQCRKFFPLKIFVKTMIIFWKKIKKKKKRYLMWRV